MKNRTIRFLSVMVGSILLVSAAEGQLRYGKFGVGLSGSGYNWQSDLKSSDLGGGGAVDVTYSLAEHWGLRSSLGANTFPGTNVTLGAISTYAFHGNLYVSYDLMPHENFNPFIFAGAGLVYFDPRTTKGAAATSTTTEQWDIHYLGGVGFDYFLNEFWSITVSAEAAYTNTDMMDGVKAGSTNDLYQRVSIGVKYYLFDKDFVARMIEMFGKRQ